MSDPLTSDFRQHAACRDSDPELFFPVGDAGPAQRQITAAKAVCARCPVIEDCLASAIHLRHEHGVWGGQDMAERGDLHRRNLVHTESPVLRATL